MMFALPFEIRQLDEDDPQAVHAWAFGMCRDASMETLGVGLDVDSPSPEAVIADLVEDLRGESRKAAERGCWDGLAARNNGERKR